MKAETTAQGGGSGKAVNLPDNPNTGVELEHFGMVAIRALELTELSKPALRLLVAMSYHGGRGRKCYTSQMTLARECGWARGKYPDTRRLRRYLAELQGFDLIYPAGRHVWTDGHWSNAYWVAPYRDRDTESQTDDSDTEGTDSDKESQTASDAIVTSGATDRDNPDQPIVTGSHDKENPATDPSKRPSKKRASRDYRADAWDSLGEVGT